VALEMHVQKERREFDRANVARTKMARREGRKLSTQKESEGRLRSSTYSSRLRQLSSIEGRKGGATGRNRQLAIRKKKKGETQKVLRLKRRAHGNRRPRVSRRRSANQVVLRSGRSSKSSTIRYTNRFRAWNQERSAIVSRKGITKAHICAGQETSREFIRIRRSNT